MDKQHIGIFYTFISGATSGVCYWTSIFPIDVVKSALMTDSIYKEKKKYKGIVDATL